MRRRAVAGDPTLLGDLVDCFRDDLVSFLSGRCGNADDAEDAAQDVFEAATKFVDSYRGDSSMRTWLYRIASNACTRMRRGGKNDPKRHQPYDTAGPGGDVLASSSLEGRLEARLMPLREALEALNTTDRAVLMLRDGQELTTREVAEALDLSASAVKSRLHRARRGVRERLED